MASKRVAVGGMTPGTGCGCDKPCYGQREEHPGQSHGREGEQSLTGEKTLALREGVLALLEETSTSFSEALQRLNAF